MNVVQTAQYLFFIHLIPDSLLA